MSSSAPRRWSWRPDGVGALAVGLALLLAYFPALRGTLLWNDSDYVTAPALRSVRGLGRIWFELGATEQYYPLLHSAFWLEFHLWGDRPLGYHLANLALHAAAAILFAGILRRFLAPGAAWFGALLFALHPVAVESVAWISEQKNTLSTVFYLAAALLYLRFRERREPATPASGGGGGIYALATGCFLLALLSKSVTATLPAALLVVFWWQRGRLTWRETVPLGPWFALGAASGLFSAWVERRYLGAQGPDFALSLGARAIVAGHEIWFYLGKLLWPAHLTFIYPRWEVESGVRLSWLWPVGVVALLVAAWLFRRRNRGPLAALLFFAGSLFPTLGFFNVYAFLFSFVADHWQYLASLGIFALLAGAGARWESAARAWGAAAVLLVLGLLTWLQCARYRGAEVFYRTIVADNPAAWMAQNNLGILLARSARLPEAIEHYAAALRLRPNYAEARNNLGNALARSGRLSEATEEYRVALQLDPAYRDAHGNLGNALLQAGQRAAAISEYEEALRIDPDYPQARNNLGSALREAGRLPEAVAQFRRAAQLEPDDPEVHNDLGVALAETGRVAEGIAEIQTAIRLRPDYPDARRNLAVLQAAAGGRRAP